MSNKISIIIPIYNLENHIDQCLQSICSQLSDEIEVICIDDGSCDNSLKILKEYENKYSKIKVIHQENKGVSAARNTCLKTANGEYVLFVDGDDYLKDDAIKHLINCVNASDPDLVFFDYQIIGQKNYIYKSGNMPEDKGFFFDDNIEYCFKNLNITNCMVNKLFKRSFINNNNIEFMDSCKYGEDSLFIMSFLVYNPKIQVLNKILYNVVERQDSSTRGISKEVFIQGFNDFQKYIDIVKNGLKPNISLYAYTLDKVFSVIICGSWRYAYFSDYKKLYLDAIKNYLEKCSEYPVNILENLRGYKKINKELKMAKFHISWLYWKVLHPAVKQGVVLPYRNINKFFRSQHGQ